LFFSFLFSLLEENKKRKEKGHAIFRQKNCVNKRSLFTISKKYIFYKYAKIVPTASKLCGTRV